MSTYFVATFCGGEIPSKSIVCLENLPSSAKFISTGVDLREIRSRRLLRVRRLMFAVARAAPDYGYSGLDAITPYDTLEELFNKNHEFLDRAQLCGVCANSFQGLQSLFGIHTRP